MLKSISHVDGELSYSDTFTPFTTSGRLDSFSFETNHRYAQISLAFAFLSFMGCA